jgi:hypothetical protein
VQAFCQAVRGQTAITDFQVSSTLGCTVSYECIDLLYSALATLPALRSVRLSHSERQARPEDDSTMAHHESLTELLRMPSLRWASFEHINFTPELCQATANALMEGTVVTKLDFRFCSFPDGEECAVMLANSLSRNTSVSKIYVESPLNQTICSTLASALPSNSSLRDISFSGLWCPGLSSVVSALGKNTGLKTLEVSIPSRKSLSAFRMEVVAMLQEKASLESVTINSANSVEVKAEDYLVLYAALQHNSTLKTLDLDLRSRLELTAVEDKQVAALLKKNYALQCVSACARVGDVRAILRLNKARRRYLIEDGSSISKGVRVLSAVSDDINCVFYHLLENPRLCDRSAIEMVSDSAEDASVANHNGKREQDEALSEGKESRKASMY